MLRFVAVITPTYKVASQSSEIPTQNNLLTVRQLIYCHKSYKYRRECFMRKGITLFTLILILVFTFVSCKNDTQEPGSSGSSQETTENISNSVTVLKKMHVKAGQTYALDGEYTLKDGIVLANAESSRALGSSDNNLLTTCDGHKMPLPDKNNKITFNPEDLGITTEGDIFIGKYKQTDDLTITAKEMEQKNVHGYYDEYYYIDLTDPKWADLDKSDIVIRLTSHPGDGSYSILKVDSILRNHLSSLDMSSFNGFGIYMYTHREQGFDYIPDCKIHVTNPIDLTLGNEITVDELFSVLRVKPGTGSEEYCIIITGLDKNTVRTMENEYYYRNSLSNYSYVPESGVIPYFFPEQGTIIYYIGEISNTFMMNLDFEPYFTGLSAINAKVKLEKRENCPGIPSYSDYIDLSVADEKGLELKPPANLSGLITIPMKFDGSLTATVTANEEFNLAGNGRYWTKSSSGTVRFPVVSPTAFKEGPWVGYVVVNTGNREIPKDTVLFTIKTTQILPVKPGHIYSYVPEKIGYWYGQYKCLGHEDSLSYLAVDFLHEKGKEFWKGSFTSSKSIEDLGKLEIKDVWMGPADSNVDYTPESKGASQEESKFYLSFSIGSTFYTYEIGEFRYMSANDKAMNGKLVIVENGKERTIDNLEFTYQI